MRSFEALCLRDCVQDANEELRRPYVRYRQGKMYTIREDSPLLVYFRPVEELSKKEGERVEAEENLARPIGSRKARRVSTATGPGFAEIAE